MDESVSAVKPADVVKTQNCQSVFLMRPKTDLMTHRSFHSVLIKGGGGHVELSCKLRAVEVPHAFP